jgi:hypothetical protein
VADLICNVAKGRIAEFHNRVQSNDPANSAFVWVALVVSGDQDDAIRDADTLAAVEALDNVAEATNTGYARQTWTNAELSAISPDDANNRMDLDGPDVVFSAITAGDNWTDLLLCYDPDTTSGTDANLIPLALFDFPITTDGSSITAQINASGYFRAS